MAHKAYGFGFVWVFGGQIRQASAQKAKSGSFYFKLNAGGAAGLRETI